MEEFVYTGNGQSVPMNVVRVRFHRSVTEVGDNTFVDCELLKEVVLNEGLKKIGQYAFSDCNSLKSITLPSTLIEIEESAFENCSNLQKIELHEGPQKIGESAFYGCRSLVTISLPSTVTEIGKYAFQSCRNLRKVGLHENIETIGAYAFDGCSSLGRLLTFPTISSRLNNIIVESEVNRIDAIRGDMIERRGNELFVPGPVLRLLSSNWNTIKASLDRIVSWIKFHEIKEATTLFELALWKAKMNESGATNAINREASRIEVPGPVKETILQYLG